ncbi:hypothetical protein M422DRAFT_269442 [Sphaerobolus stellatus SS14]|uniref:Tc1-like transposase DDE domain-containing protein n=1 Tax=Sphaerobolus stellatus (strain SS14) TaxID=990650 RepID=A0A0C9UVF4_SPHS4|nr:hypothetical protein M422DRAFT_269442 [Sphaerobolus stellatus SS14]
MALADGYTVQEICHVLNASDRSIRRWSRLYDELGDVVPLPNPNQGRPRFLKPLQVHSLAEKIQECPEMYLDELRDWLALEHDVAIPISTLDQNIREAGLSHKLLRRRAIERDEIARAACKDERTIYHHYGRAFQGQTPTISAKFIRGDRYSILPAISVNGYLTVRIIPGSVNAAQFFEFIVEDVLPRMSRYPLDNSVLIMDNCAIHKTWAL